MNERSRVRRYSRVWRHCYIHCFNEVYKGVIIKVDRKFYFQNRIDHPVENVEANVQNIIWALLENDDELLKEAENGR